MNLIADEKIICVSPDPQNIYLYTPGLLEGFNGRLIASIDFGGPGTDKLDGPKSALGDYTTGNQVRVMLSDDGGETWRDTSARLPMRHEILFKAGKALYMLGFSGNLVITRSDDNGETWSVPAILSSSGRWIQGCGTVDHHNGRITLTYEREIYPGHPWPGEAPVLMSANEEDDLTSRSAWRFSKPFNPDTLMALAIPSGTQMMPLDLSKEGAPGILEASTLRIVNPNHPFYDPKDKTVLILMRGFTGFPDIGAILKGVEKEDGSLEIQQVRSKYDTALFLLHIPGGSLKFHLAYDEKSKLYWMVHSQIDGLMNPRRRLALSYSPDLLSWSFAGLVAVGPCDNGSRHYATMVISGDDILILSRSGDEKAKSPHDNNLTTFHRVRNFRRLVE